MRTPSRARILAAAALATASTLAAPALGSLARASATPVSPGARDEPVEIDGRCPTFSWSPAPASAGTELALYALEASGAGPEARLLLHRRLPAGAGSYTLGRIECLEPGGQYAWLVRPIVREDAGSGRGLAPWSDLLRFRVAARPSDTELVAAIEVVRRYLAATRTASSPAGAALPAGSTLPPGSTAAVGAGAQRGEESPTGLTGSVAVRGENVTATGDAIGVAGLTASAEGAGLAASNLGGGPDLRLIALAGADATMSETGIRRSSPSPQTFEIGNPEGVLTLTIDGVPAVTTATDQDTLGALACTSGQVAKWTGSAWQCAADADSDTQYAAGNQLELTGTTFDVVEGSGSGLDADTLDGFDASALAPAAHLHDDRYFTETELSVSGAGGIVHWQNLASRPAGLDDGDNDTLGNLSWCSAGQVPTWTGYAWWCLTPTERTLRPTQTISGQVDTTGDVGSYSSITVRTNGTPIIAYYDFTNGDLKVATCNDLSCGSALTRTVDSSGDVGAWPSIAVDRYGYVVISYYDASNGDLKLARCQDSDCSSATIFILDSSGDVGPWSAVSVDRFGSLVVTYYDLGNGDLKIAYCNGADCSSPSVDVLDSVGVVGWWASGAVSPSAYGWPGASVVYYDLTNQSLKYYFQGPRTLTLTGSPTNVAFPALAFDSFGLPAIAFANPDSGDLVFGFCSTSFCEYPIGGGDRRVTAAPVGTVLAAGPDGMVTAVYHDENDGWLHLATCSRVGFFCQERRLFPGGWNPSVTYGVDGLPIFSYYDASEGDLRVAHCGNAFCTDFYRPR